MSAALLAAGLLPAPPARAEDAVPAAILFLQSDRGEDSWIRDLESALDAAAPARAHLVERCAVGARAVGSCLAAYRPRLIVARVPPPAPAAAELRAQGLPLIVAGGSPADAATAILARSPDGAGESSPASLAAGYESVARAHFERGDHAGTKANLSRALALEPKSFPALELLFRAEMRGGWLRDAESAADRAAALEGLAGSRRAGILTGRADARALLGDAGGAEQDLREALRLRPGDEEASFLLARVLRDRPREALPYAERAALAAGNDGRRAAALRLAAMIRRDLGDEAGARRALASAPRPPGQELDALQSEFELERERPREAAAVAERALRAAESTPSWARPAAYRLCASLWLELKDYPRALESLKAALALAPDDLYTLEAMVQIKRERPNGGLDFAAPAPAAASGPNSPPGEAALRSALASDPEDLDALSGLIELAREREDIPARFAFAARFLDAAREASPWRQPAAYRFIARVWSELGDDENVQKSLGVARDLDRRSLEFEELAQSLRRPDARAGVYAANRAEAHAAIARARQELGDEAGAERDLRLALEQDPRSPAALRLLARRELDRGRAREALAAADRLVASTEIASPAERADGERLRAVIELALRDDAAAEKSVERALELAPDDLDGLGLAIRVEQELGRPRRALDDARRLVDATRTAPAPRRAAALVQEAGLRLALKDDEGAARSLEAALALDPSSREALELMSERLLSRKRPREALTFAGRLLEASAKAPPEARADALRLRARGQDALGDLAGARASLEAALALEKDPRPGLKALLQLELAHGRPREALAYAERLADSAGGAPPAERADDERQKARLQLELGDACAARRSLERSLALDPADGEAPRLLMRLELSLGRAREALGAADLLVAASTAAPAAERADALRQRARLRLELGDGAGARADFERALAASPEDLDSLWMLVSAPGEKPGEALELVKSHRPSAPGLRARWLVLRGMASAMAEDAASARGDFEAAVKADSAAVCFGDLAADRRDRLDPLFFTACLGAFPGSAALRSDRGVALYRSGRAGEAVADFRRAVELDPGLLEARLSLANALAAQGRADEAEAEAERGLARPEARASPVYRELAELRDSLARRRR